MLIKNKIFL